MLGAGSTEVIEVQPLLEIALCPKSGEEISRKRLSWDSKSGPLESTSPPWPHMQIPPALLEVNLPRAVCGWVFPGMWARRAQAPQKSVVHMPPS